MNTLNETWDEFSRRVLGDPYLIWHDGGVDEYQVKGSLAGEDPAYVEKMLKHGLALDDYIAVEGIKLLNDPKWLVLLRNALPKSSPRTQVWIASYLQEKCPEEDYSAPLLKLLSSSAGLSRVDAAIALRHFKNPPVLLALLDSVSKDPEYLVRYHCANSYLTLRGIQPAEIFDHPEIFALLTSSAPPEDTVKAAALLEAL